MSAPTPADFPAIYQTYHARVLALAARLLGAAEAEDIAQEVFAKIHRSLATLKDPPRMASWVYTIALNTIRDAARGRAHRPMPAPGRPGGRGEPPAGGAEPPVPEIPDRGSRTPEETAIRNEMIACYLEYVTRLPSTYYQVYVLGELEDLPSEEIARRLSLSVGAVKIRLHRARAVLRRRLRCDCRTYVNARGELMGEPRKLSR